MQFRTLKCTSNSALGMRICTHFATSCCSLISLTRSFCDIYTEFRQTTTPSRTLSTTEDPLPLQEAIQIPSVARPAFPLAFSGCPLEDNQRLGYTLEEKGYRLLSDLGHCDILLQPPQHAQPLGGGAGRVGTKPHKRPSGQHMICMVTNRIVVFGREHCGGGLAQVGLVLLHQVTVPQLCLIHE